MRKFVVFVIVGALGLYGYRHCRAEADRSTREAAPAFEMGLVEQPSPAAPPADDTPPAAGTNYRCDGRQYCSQMTSCEEATWHLQNCTGMKMDGDRDGVPCEQQWCRGG